MCFNDRDLGNSRGSMPRLDNNVFDLLHNIIHFNNIPLIYKESWLVQAIVVPLPNQFN